MEEEYKLAVAVDDERVILSLSFILDFIYLFGIIWYILLRIAFFEVLWWIGLCTRIIILCSSED